MAAACSSDDRNLAANIWYNYMDKYPDSSSQAMASKQIRQLREAQGYLEEDTTSYARMDIFWANAKVSDRRVAVSASVFPNPTSENWNLEITVDKEAALEIAVVNVATGIAEFSITASAKEGKTVHAFKRPQTAGTYLVRITVNNEVLTRKLIVE